ncbi:RHS repeat-associated core domain-containing protein [Planctomycetota bacterium]
MKLQKITRISITDDDLPSSFGSASATNCTFSIYASYIPDSQQDTGLTGNPYMFTGRRFDLETGLYYYRARYYNPYIGRFLQVDPIGYEDSINLYTYCLNNPINLTDPSGEGILKRLYTGDWNASDELYEASVLAFIEALMVPEGSYEGEGTYCDNWVIESEIGAALLWADALGIYGESGRSDTFTDVNFLHSLINPYPDVGPNEVRGDQEGFWANVHYRTGFAMGLIGIDRESAELLMETWEITEPGIWTGWGRWLEYQGRDNFEGGEQGWEFDMIRGLEGYDDAVHRSRRSDLEAYIDDLDDW